MTHPSEPRVTGVDPLDLVDATKFHDPVDLDGVDSETLRVFLRKMLLIRRAEEVLGEKVEAGVVRCPCHLGIGQEAVAVGLSAALRDGDRVFGAHRSHSHFLALNDDAFSLFAETLGRVDGCSRGMGGSMHLVDRPNGFYGSVPIVAATVPIAAGAALASKMANDGSIAVSYFGDGATEEGGVQETLNAAASMGLPIIFVCENNLFSSHMHISLRQPDFTTARFAEAHRIPGATIDGNDVVAVYKTALQAVESARNGVPFFVEAFTYRWRGHVGHREDSDVGVKRDGDLGLWKRRDPIGRLRQAMATNNTMTDESWLDLCEQVDKAVQTAWSRAEKSPFPELAALEDLVYDAQGEER